eukprot:COSAG02_NODE_582_length_20017_cov_26.599608_11_plen_97_part_00
MCCAACAADVADVAGVADVACAAEVCCICGVTVCIARCKTQHVYRSNVIALYCARHPSCLPEVLPPVVRSIYFPEKTIKCILKNQEPIKLAGLYKP